MGPIWLYHALSSSISSSSGGALVPPLEQQTALPHGLDPEPWGNLSLWLETNYMQIWEEGMRDNDDKSKMKILTILNWSTLFLSRFIGLGQLIKEQQGPESLWSPDRTESELINSNAKWMGPTTRLPMQEYPIVLTEMYYQTERNGIGDGIWSWFYEITGYIFSSWNHTFLKWFSYFLIFSCIRIILKCLSS